MANRGRPRRDGPKSRAIWCGQMTPEERALILEYTTPLERREWLLGAARLIRDMRCLTLAAKPRIPDVSDDIST